MWNTVGEDFHGNRRKKMSEFEKGIEWLLDVCAPWEVISITKREQAEGLGRGGSGVTWT